MKMEKEERIKRSKGKGKENSTKEALKRAGEGKNEREKEGIDVASMWLDVASIWHRCGIDVGSTWHQCGIDVASM